MEAIGIGYYQEIKVHIKLTNIHWCNGCPMCHRRKVAQSVFTTYWWECSLGHEIKSSDKGKTIIRSEECKTDNRTRIIGE